jgi:hypothetical protein
MVKFPFAELHGLEDAQYNFEWLEAHLAAASGGSVTAARAHRATAFTTTANTWVKVPLDAKDYDPTGLMDTTGRYTCPVAGVYQAAGQIRLTGVAANQVVGVGIYKNGVKAAEGGAATAGQAGDEAVTVADLLNCNAGDYIELYIYCSAADNVVLGAADNYLAVAEITGTGLQGPPGPPGPPGASGGAGYYSAAGPGSAGTSWTIPQATHGLRAQRGILVQVQDGTSGAVEIPDVSVDAAGNVTVTYAAAVAANSKLVVLIG